MPDRGLYPAPSCKYLIVNGWRRSSGEFAEANSDYLARHHVTKSREYESYWRISRRGMAARDGLRPESALVQVSRLPDEGTGEVGTRRRETGIELIHGLTDRWGGR